MRLATAETTVIVTGAVGTIGSSVFGAALSAGYQGVALVRRESQVDALAARLGIFGDSFGAVYCDLASDPSLDTAGRQLRELVAGRRVVLVNSAGIHGPLERVEKISPHHWNDVIRLNLVAPITLAQSLLPDMVEFGWGRIINMSSMASNTLSPFNGPYALSKVALNRYTAQLALELATTGVTAHALHPGDVQSSMSREIHRRASAGPHLADYARWAESTAADDPNAAAQRVLSLIDDRVAAASNGHFLYPVGDERPPIVLIPSA
jgi:NAD(P)-dependent dehydrogenase (short-subunit alcohol dehydrogenase family)